MAKAAHSEPSAGIVRFDVFTVRSYQVDGEDRNEWNQVGVAFEHADKEGFHVRLQALPVNGELVIRKHKPKSVE